MTDKCPTEGYTCVNQLRARVQSVTDQLIGFKAFLEETKHPATPAMILQHYGKAAELLQLALSEYAEGHGIIPVQDDVDSVRWVLMKLKQ